MTEQRTLDAEKALELLEGAVAERGAEYVYQQSTTAPACRYVRDGQPDCLVGVVLVAEGVPIEALSYIDNFSADGEHVCTDNCPDDCSDATIGSEWAQQVIRERSGLSLSSQAVRALRSAQGYQDSGRTWGEALTAAHRAVDEGRVLRPYLDA